MEKLFTYFSRLPAWLLVLLVFFVGCGGGKPADPTNDIKARFQQFHGHLIKGEIDPSLGFLEPEFMTKRGEASCKGALKIMSDSYKTNATKDEDVRVDKIDPSKSGTSAKVFYSRQVKKVWGAVEPEKWVLVGGKWYYSP